MGVNKIKSKNFFSWGNILPLALILFGALLSSVKITGNIIGVSNLHEILGASFFSVGLVWMVVVVKLQK
ncbi:hypothetical protein GW932_03215 [archaeon]|nr:hypothetical protein [archaeon]